MKYFFRAISTLILGIIIQVSTTLRAQEDPLLLEIKVQDIKADRLNLYAEMTDESQTLARDAAKKLVVEQIVQSVFSQSNLESKQADGKYTENFSMTVRSTSKLNLQGLKFLDFGKLTDGRYKSFAYINQNDVEKSFADVAEQIKGVILTAEQVEKSLGLPKAIDQYLRAYLQTYYSPRPVKYKSELQNVEFPDARGFLDLKLKLYLSQLDVKVLANQIEESGTERTAAFTVPIELFYRNQPVEKLYAKLESQDSPQITVLDGKGKFILYGEPEAPKKEYRLKLIPFLDRKTLPPDMLENYESERFVDNRRIQIDFSKIVQVDFTAAINGMNVEFTPSLKHLSLLPDGTQWDFGDGNATGMFKPTTRYAKPGKYKVSLKVNKNNDLVVTKEIEIKGEQTPQGNTALAPVPMAPKVELPKVFSMLQLNSAADSLFSMLVELKKKGLITFGKQTDFTNTDRCVLILVDPKQKAVANVISEVQTDKARKEYFSGEIVNDVKSKSKGMQAIWVQIN